jgi:hypothetical protein
MNPHCVSGATTVNSIRLVAYTSGVLRARSASGEVDCEVTVCTNTTYGHEHQCGQTPFAPGARLCAKHEADRIRLGGDRG